MPRQARLQIPGLFYHVMVRGIEKRTIFRADSDRWDFLRRLGDGLSRSGARCFSWAFMTNHLHLLIMSGLRGLSALMQPLLTGYAVTFNLKYKRVGHLFQNRYKAIICEEDPYFLQLVRYIALQPVQAGLIQTPEELARYPWTSHRALMGGPSEAWMETDDVLGRFGDTRAEARRAYERFVVDGWTQGHRPDLEGGGLLRSVGGLKEALALRQEDDAQQADLRILGSGDFVKNILAQAEAAEAASHTMTRHWSQEDLLSAVCELEGASPAALMAGDRRDAVCAARALTIFAAREWLGMPGADLAGWLRMTEGSVSRAYWRGKQRAADGRLWTYLQSKKSNNVPPPLPAGGTASG